MLFFFNLFVLFLIFLDIGAYKRNLTPLTLVALVYVILIDINNIFASEIYGFYKVSGRVMIILSFLFFLIFLIDALFGSIYRKIRKIDSCVIYKYRNFTIIATIFTICVAAYAVQFFRLYQKFGLEIKGMNNGILAHLSNVALVLAPLSVEMAMRKKKIIPILAMIILNLIILGISVLFGGKYVIFINLTYFCLFFVLKRNRKFDITEYFKIGVILASLAVLVFFIIYFIIPRATGKYLSSIEFVIRHTAEYLLGPIVANNDSMISTYAYDERIPYTVLLNIAKAITGNREYVSPIYPFVFNLSAADMTNVSGFFGEVIYSSGFLSASLYIVLVFGFMNILFIAYRAKGLFILSYCYVNAILPFLFFCNFFSVSGVVLPLLIAIIFDLLSIVRIGKFHI